FGKTGAKTTYWSLNRYIIDKTKSETRKHTPDSMQERGRNAINFRDLKISEIPMFSIRATSHQISIGIIKHFFLRVPLQWTLQFISNVDRVTNRRGAVTDLHVTNGFAPFFNGIYPVLIMVIRVIH